MFKLPIENHQEIESALTPYDRIKIDKTADNSNMLIFNDQFSARIGKKSGFLEQFQYQGMDILLTPLKHNFWRALTDNDRLGQPNYDLSLGMFKEEYVEDEIEFTGTEITQSEDGSDNSLGSNYVKLTTKYRMPNGADGEGDEDFDFSEYLYAITFFGNGEMILDCEFENKNVMPRFGIQFTAPKKFGQKLEYFGLGPHENYIDRKSSAITGKFTTSVEAMKEKYVCPQEYGNRMETRWMQLGDDKGNGIRFEGLPHFEFCVWPYSMENLVEAKHINELIEQGYITINIDSKQMGVGGYDTWSGHAHPLLEHSITPGIQKLKVKIIPLHEKK